MTCGCMCVGRAHAGRVRQRKVLNAVCEQFVHTATCNNDKVELGGDATLESMRESLPMSVLVQAMSSLDAVTWHGSEPMVRRARPGRAVPTVQALTCRPAAVHEGAAAEGAGVYATAGLERWRRHRARSRANCALPARTQTP